MGVTAERTVKGKNPSLRLLSLIQFRVGGVRGGVNFTVMAVMADTQESASSDVSDVTRSHDTIAFVRFVLLYLRTNCFPR